MYTFLIIMLLLASLLYILYRNPFEETKGSNKAFELERSFTQLLRKHKLSIDEVAVFNSKVIGLDKKKGKLIWIEYVDNAFQQNCIALNELESHKITKVLNGIEGCFSKIVMELFPRDQKPASFTFYDRYKDDKSAFSYLLDKAKYWDAIIHLHVNTYNPKHSFEYVL